MKLPLLHRPLLVAGWLLAATGWGFAKEPATPEEESADGVAAAESDRAQDQFSRETPEMAAAWSSLLETARRSTARILREGKPIALATAVNEKGWLLTKSSEVHDSKGKPLANLSAQFSGGITLDVKITDIHARYDLALLKVEARGLTPVEWDTSATPAPGSYLAAAGPERLPVAAEHG